MRSIFWWSLAALCSQHCCGSPVGVVLQLRHYLGNGDGTSRQLPHFTLRRSEDLTQSLRAYYLRHGVAGMPHLERLQYMLHSVQSHPKSGDGELLFGLQVDLGNCTEVLAVHERDSAVQVSREFVEQHGMLPAEQNRQILLNAVHSKLQRQFMQQSFLKLKEPPGENPIIPFYFQTRLPVLSSTLRARSRLHQLHVEQCIQHKPVFPGFEFMETVSHAQKISALLLFVTQFQLTACVETGTFEAVTTLALSDHCEKVASIELSEVYHKKAKEKLAAKIHPVGNVELYQGDSGRMMSTLSFKEFIPDQTPALFFLDGHYSAGSTARGDDDSPVFNELSAIFRRKNERDVIIVDDVRCFHGSRHAESLDLGVLNSTGGMCRTELQGNWRVYKGGERELDLSDILDFICSERPGWVVDLVNDMLQIHAPQLAVPYS